MKTTIEPALTPEGWAHFEFARGPRRDLMYGFIPQKASPDVGHVVGVLRVGFDTGANYNVPNEARHALAALALHEQPFGFTHDDVDMLRGNAREFETSGGFLPEGERLNALADRIESLLPPRTQ